MDTRKWIGVCVGALLVALAIAYFSNSFKTPSRAAVLGKASQRRPTQLPDSSKIVAFLMDGEPVIGNTIQFPCDAEHEWEIELPTEKVLPGRRGVEMVPRMLAATENDFHHVMDLSVDKNHYFYTKQKRADGSPQFSEPFQLKLKPGTYRVRYFFRTRIPTTEDEDPLPKVEYLGEGKWEILPAEEDGKECLDEPFGNPKTVHPLKFGA